MFERSTPPAARIAFSVDSTMRSVAARAVLLRTIENGPIGTQWPPNVPQRPFRAQNIRTRICIYKKKLPILGCVNVILRPYSFV